jgi:hypothetical protein
MTLPRPLDRNALMVALAWTDFLYSSMTIETTYTAAPPTTRKDVTPLIRKPGGLMEQSNASLQRGDQG